MSKYTYKPSHYFPLVFLFKFLPALLVLTMVSTYSWGLKNDCQLGISGMVLVLAVKFGMWLFFTFAMAGFIRGTWTFAVVAS